MNFTGITSDLLRRVTRIVTHADCPDGIASAMILHDALPDAKVEFIQYKTPEWRDLAATPGMLFCDMTPPRDRVHEFVDAGAIVLDHHKEQEDIVAAFGDRGVFADEVADPGVSGALLALEIRKLVRFGNTLRAVRSLAELAGIRDTWQTAHPSWREACAQAEVLMFYGAEWLLKNRPPELHHDDRELGSMLLEKRLSTARDIALHKLFRVTDEWGVFNDGAKDRGHEMISDVAEAVRELAPELIGVCGFHYAVQTDGSIDLVFSMRSCGDINVGAIAKANGGGGHTKAAGFSLRAIDSLGHPADIFLACLRRAR